MYIVKIAIADLAEYLADGKNSPEVHFTPTLMDDEPSRIVDVTAEGDEYRVCVEYANHMRERFIHDGSTEWIVTTDKEVSELG